MIFVADPDSAFTLREQQILYYIAGGLSNKEIAGRLTLSEPVPHDHQVRSCEPRGAGGLRLRNWPPLPPLISPNGGWRERRPRIDLNPQAGRIARS